MLHRFHACRWNPWNFRISLLFLLVLREVIIIIIIRGIGREKKERKKGKGKEKGEKKKKRKEKKTMRIRVLAIKLLRVVKSYSLAFRMGYAGSAER